MFIGLRVSSERNVSRKNGKVFGHFANFFTKFRIYSAKINEAKTKLNFAKIRNARKHFRKMRIFLRMQLQVQDRIVFITDGKTGRYTKRIISFLQRLMDISNLKCALPCVVLGFYKCVLYYSIYYILYFSLKLKDMTVQPILCYTKLQL